MVGRTSQKLQRTAIWRCAVPAIGRVALASTRRGSDPCGQLGAGGAPNRGSLPLRPPAQVRPVVAPTEGVSPRPASANPQHRGWRLCDITKLDVQQFVLRKFDQQLAWQTVRNAWIVLSSVLDAATKYGALAVNPARGVKFPLAPPRTAPRILGREDIGTLLLQVEEPHRTMIGLVALTGLRIGELLGLRWRGLDLANGTLRVLESVFEGKRQRPKTRRAMRTIPLGPHAVQVLTDHRGRSTRTAADDLVFPNRKGEPLRESKLLTRVLQPAAERAGLGRVTRHQFRHVHSSLLNDLGVPVKDRARATRPRQRADNAQHLHARRGWVASAGDRAARTEVVPKCS